MDQIIVTLNNEDLVFRVLCTSYGLRYLCIEKVRSYSKIVVNYPAYLPTCIFFTNKD